LKYLPDTNVWVEYLRGTSPKLKTRFEACETGDISASVVAVFELERGALASARPDFHLAAVRALCSGFQVIDFDLECAREAARLDEELSAKGLKLGQMDVFLAASALVHDLVFVTHNVRHFERIPTLKLEDWQV
jgi:tRNA(fMet)-specific endonuclease VapC